MYKTPQIINFVILTAGIGYKMRSYEPRALLKFDKIPLILHQIREIEKLRAHNFDPRIFILTGYKDDKIRKKLDKEKVHIIWNEKYNKCNQQGSIKIFAHEHVNLYGRKPENMFLIHGDIYFRTNLESLPYDSSFILYDTKDNFKSKEVGVNIGDGLGSLSYGAKTKWCQMAYITGPEIKILYTSKAFYDYMLTHEVVNHIIDEGGRFEPVSYEGTIFEIDRIKEYRIEKFNFI